MTTPNKAQHTQAAGTVKQGRRPMFKRFEPTPGPWVACSGNGGSQINIETKRADNGLLPIARLKGPNRKADARLIESAPELLDALRKIAAYIPCDTDYFKHCGALQNHARTAIAKAEGRNA